MPISLDGNLGINSSGNVTAPYYFGNGRFLTGINGSGGNGSAISSGNSSVSFDGNGNAVINIGGSNVASFSPTGLTVSNGNVVADGFFFSNGAPVVVDLGNIYTNLIPSLDSTYTLGNYTNQWKELWVSGNTIYMERVPINLSAVAFANGAVGNTLAVGGNPLIAANTDGLLGNLTVSGNAAANAFLSDQYLWANGVPFINTDGNLTVGNITSSGTISAVGNVSGGNVTTPGNVIAGGNIDGGNINTVGTVTSNAVVTNTVTSNVVVTNTVTANTATISGNIDSGNVNTTGTVTAVGNITGGNIDTLGNVSASNINASNSVVAVGNVSGGNLTTTGVVQAVGNVIGGNIVTIGNVDANAVSANLVSSLTVQTGNVIATDVYTNAITSNTANIVGTMQAGNVSTTGSVTSTGNVVGGNLVTLGNVVGNNIIASGNVETDHLIGFAVTIESTGNAQGINMIAGPNGNINVNNTYINNLAMPLQDNDAANKAYVDLVAANLRPTLSVQLSTTATLNPYTYNNGIFGIGATITFNAPAPIFIEGQPVTLNQRVLIKDEVGPNAPYNGIYVCTTQGTPSVAAVLTRATDFDEPDEVSSAYTFDEYSNTGWVCLTPPTPAPVFGTTDIIWTQFSEAAAYQAGAGLSLAGQIFNVNPDNNTIYVNGSNKIAVMPGANLPNVNIASANITGGLNVQGNTTVSNITATGTTTVNNLVSNTITSIGNITSGNLIATGTTYSNSIVSNSTVTNGNTTTTGTTISGNTITTGTTTTNAIVSNTSTTTGTSTSGNVISLGNTTTYGNATSGNVIALGNTISGNVVSLGNTTTAGTTTTSALVANTTTTSGNSTSGNVISLGNTTTTGTTTSGNTVTIGTTTTNAIVSNTSTTTGNSTSGNVVSLGNTTTAGTTTTNAIVSNTSTTTGNSTSGNVISLGDTTTTGNTTSGNITSLGDTTTLGTTTTNALVSNTTTTTGNTTTGNLLSNGTVSSATLSTTGNADIGGNLTSANFSTSGNANIGNLYVPGTTELVGNAIAGNIALTAIYTDGYFYANGVPFIGGGGGGNANAVVIGDQQIVGDGNATYALNQAATSQSVLVAINGVQQYPVTSYNVAGNTITFTGNVSNTALIDVRYFAASGGNSSIYGDANVAAYLPQYTGNLGTANTTPVTAIFTDGYYYANGTPVTFGGGGNGNYGNSNVINLLSSADLTSNIITSGNVFGSYFVGNGRFLTGVISSYGDSNVETLLASGNVSSNIITTANISGGNVTGITAIAVNSGVANSTVFRATTSGANSFIQTGNGTSGTTGNIIFSPLNNANPRVTVNTDIGNVTAVGNIEASYFIGNGAFLTGGYGNAQVEALLESGNISNNIITTGNVTANVFFGNGSQLTGMYGNANVEILLESGNIANNIITTGNITGDYYFGNGRFLTGMYGNADVELLLETGISNNIITTGNISGGNIAITGNADVGGNVNGNNINATAQVTAVGNITGGNITTVGLANVGNLVVTGTSTLIGNTQASNIDASGVVVAVGNVSGANFVTAGNAIVTGNVDAGNVNTNNLVGTALTITSTTSGVVFDSGGNINAGNSLIHNVVNPVAAGDAANKYYVDAYVQGLTVKEAVVAATTTALPAYVYSNGVSGAGANIVAQANGTISIDGTGNVLTTASRVLVKNETAGNAVVNGIYVVTNLGNSTAPFVLTRSLDMNAGGEFPSAFIFVSDGTVNESSGWVCTNAANSVTVGSTAIVFSQFSYAGGYSAGNGLVLTGTQFSAAVDPETMWINGSNEIGVKPNANLTTPNIGNATFQSLTLLAGGTGNITANNIAIAGVAEVTGNLVAGNVETAQVVANGNITSAQNIVASANITGDNINATTVNATGNVTGGNIISLDTVYTVDAIATGNVTANNLVVNNDLVTSGNITANNLVATNSLTANVGNIVDLTTANVTVANVLTATTANLTDITASNITATTANLVTLAANTYYYGGNGLPVVFYADANVQDFLASGNLTGNIITTGNITGNYIFGNGAYLTGLPIPYNDANVIALLESGNLTSNIITTGEIFGSDITVTGNATVGGNAIVSGNLSADNAAIAGNTSAGNSTVSGNSSVTGNIDVGGILTDNIYYANGQPYIFSTYGNSNVEAFLGSGTITGNIITSGNIVSNDINANTLTINQFTNLGNLGNVTISGGANNYAILTDGSGNLFWGLAAPAAVPAVYFTATANGNGQVFSNVVLSAYNNAEDMNVFYNGALLEYQYYTFDPLLARLTVNTPLFIGDTIDVARQVAGSINNVTSGYGDSNVEALLSGGITTDINTSGNIQADYYIGNGALLTGIQTSINSVPAVYFTATSNASGQTFSNVVLGSYTSAADMTVFLNGALLENSFYDLVGDQLTVNTYLRVDDNIDVITQFAGNVVSVSSGYGNSNVATYLASGINTANIVVGTGGYFIGDGSLLSNISVGGNYGNSNVSVYLASGTDTAGIITTGDVSANAFIGDGSQLTGLPASYGNSNVSIYLAGGTDTAGYITTGDVTANAFIGDGSQLTGLPAGYTDANVTTLLASGNVTTDVVTTANISGSYILGNGAFLTGVQTPIAQIPAVYMVAAANGTGQVFSNVILGSYTANTDMTVFLNGVLLENTSYTLAGDSLTINEYVYTGDNIEVIRQFAVGNVLNITSGYGNSNVAAYLPTYTGNLSGTGLTINGNAVITGNAQIQGTLTYNNVTDITTSNLQIALGFNQSGANVDNGGMVIGSTQEAQFLYDQPTQTWNSNLGIVATGNVTGANFNTAGKVTATGNVTGGNITSAGAVVATGNIAGGNVATSGVVVATGNVSGGNVTTSGVVVATGNITGGNVFSSAGKLLAANITSPTAGQILSYNGTTWVNSSSGGAITGTWTLTPGVNNVSFTAPGGASYNMFVNGNIPNGIVIWQATVTLSNNNVPVIGSQYGWYYGVGNALVLTSMPNQIIGNSGSIISNTPGGMSLPTNTFNFSITNNSGSNQVVTWSYRQI